MDLNTQLATTVRSLHKWTGVTITLIAIILMGINYCGSPINCQSPILSSVPSNFVNQYCWFHSTATLTSGLSLGIYKVWKWTCLALILQGLAFYCLNISWELFDKRYHNTFLNSITTSSNTETNHNFGLEHFRNSMFPCLDGSKNECMLENYVFRILNLMNLGLQILLLIVCIPVGSGSLFPNGIPSASTLLPVDVSCFLPPLFEDNRTPNDRHCIVSINVIINDMYSILWFWLLCLFVVSTIELLFEAYVKSSYLNSNNMEKIPKEVNTERMSSVASDHASKLGVLGRRMMFRLSGGDI